MGMREHFNVIVAGFNPITTKGIEGERDKGGRERMG